MRIEYAMWVSIFWEQNLRFLHHVQMEFYCWGGSFGDKVLLKLNLVLAVKRLFTQEMGEDFLETSMYEYDLRTWRKREENANLKGCNWKSLFQTVIATFWKFSGNEKSFSFLIK